MTTNLDFEVIQSKPIEMRTSTRIQDRSGKLLKQSDVTMSLSEAWSMRESTLTTRKMTKNQVLTLRGTNARYDKVSLFGLRPVELLELFPRIGNYYEWFKIEKRILGADKIKAGLNDDILKCEWIDVD